MAIERKRSVAIAGAFVREPFFQYSPKRDESQNRNPCY
jgi:hypothetical protein